MRTKHMISRWVPAVACLVLAACGGSGLTSTPGPATPQPVSETANTRGGGTAAPTPKARATPVPPHPMAVERVFPNLAFKRLTNLVQPDDGRDRLIVTEQGGRIHVFPNQQQVEESALFLELSARVRDVHNEEGLLGLAFDPHFQETGYFYVYYSASDPPRSVLSRFSAPPDDPGAADAGSELIILEIPQPAGNHNGGQLAFGPDGYLYVGVGDGGLGGDPFGNGQNTATLLGSILRIDVAAASEDEPYRIPPDNPLLGVDARQEVWAYGLRNPWRFSFDPQTGLMWAGDVGQNSWEEIDLVEKGLNYGWNVMEGGHCYSPRRDCDGTGLRLPLAEYGSAKGCSIIGGHVYRGPDLPSLLGAYIYGDFCSGKIWALRYDGQSVTENLLLADSGLQITSFGLDLARNLYILSRNSGVYRLVPRE